MRLLLLLFFAIPLVAKDHIAVYRLGHVTGETIPEPGLNEIMGKNKIRPLNFMHLLSCLNYCKGKNEVKAVVLYTQGMRLGLAQKQELARRIREVRSSGKEVYLYAYGLDESTLPLAQSTQVSLFPHGEVSFRGISMQQLYFKGMLDKLGLKADLIHIGDYKSAGEPFYLTKPSPEAAEQQLKLGEAIFAELTHECSLSERKSMEDYSQLIEKGFFAGSESVNAKIVDKLEYHNHFIKRIKDKYPSAKLTLNYGMPKGFKPPQINNMMDAFAFLQKLSAPKREPQGDILSLVNLDGTIEPIMAEKLRRHILRAAHNKKVKAMVLRINSPGGSALASEMICQATEVFTKTGKPFIVSFANVAASGGYYAAVFGKPIFAENATITGSIGVFGGKLVTSGMMDKIGITTHQVKIGKYSDINSSISPFNEVQREKVIESMLRVYDNFKGRVMQGRKDQLKGDLESMAGGRVYTGRQAKELGLVDEIGGLREAINEAKKQAKMEKYRLDIYPEQLTFEELIMESFRPQKEEDEFVSLSIKSQDFLKMDWLSQILGTMKVSNPELVREIQRFLGYVTLLKEQNVLLLDPRFN